MTGSIARKPPRGTRPGEGPGSGCLDRKAAHRRAAGLDQPGAASRARGQRPGRRYELGIRYAEGRGLPQSTEEAARWLERAAHAGFAPAQFRFAGLNEKGDGVKKDVQTARTLYLAAAGKGHAKAMHNLAVLHAEGVDGKPDYKAAAQWFQKASNYGVTDSQYNLAILYARGIGIAANLAESYRWFALAAAGGDSEAAKKRDEVAARLDAEDAGVGRSRGPGLCRRAASPTRRSTSRRRPAAGTRLPPRRPRRGKRPAQ